MAARRYQQFMKILVLISFTLIQSLLNQNCLKFDSKPNLFLKIALDKNKYKVGEEILITMAVKNVGKKKEKLIFEAQSSFPWATRAILINTLSNKSAVKWQNVEISSQIYLEEQLTKYYYELEPGKSTLKKFKLSDIIVFNGIVFNGKGFTLPKGKYELEIEYYNNSSNKITFEVI